jgi:hypothetical protein
MAGQVKWTHQRANRLWRDWLKGGGLIWSPAYHSFLNVRSFSSRGFTSEVVSRKFGRPFVLFSYAERGAFFVFEARPDVEGLCEQVPLDPQETQRLALELGITHPCYPRTKVPMVMTCDFLILVRTAQGTISVAIDVKDDTGAMAWRTTEKLMITRTYYARRGIRHLILFSKDIPEALVNNLEWIRMAEARPGEILSCKEQLDELAGIMADELASTCFDSRPLDVLCRDFDARHGQRPGRGLRIARILMARRVLSADLLKPTLAEQPLSNFALSPRWPALLEQKAV